MCLWMRIRKQVCVCQFTLNVVVEKRKIEGNLEREERRVCVWQTSLGLRNDAYTPMRCNGSKWVARVEREKSKRIRGVRQKGFARRIKERERGRENTEGYDWSVVALRPPDPTPQHPTPNSMYTLASFVVQCSFAHT